MSKTEAPPSHGPLDGILVVDLSRILAGPTATQLLGDFGATIIKVENPRGGDDTRTWGPPYAEVKEGQSDLSAYFMAANRNKHSIAVDFATTEGQVLVNSLLPEADIVIENYKPGGLKKFGLDHETVLKAHPHLVYCSISGFGQTGPNRDRPGYDLLAQGFGGIMSLTGDPEGPPMKVGVGIADVMCGMYAASGILAALHHRERTGEGQHIDLALVDAQMAWLINEGTNTLLSGVAPRRRGNAHPNIVPYDVFETTDGHIILAVGNDGQFRRFCEAMDCPELATDPRFRTNPDRIANRDALTPSVTSAIRRLSSAEVLSRLERADVSAGPIHTVPQALHSEQAKARNMVVDVAAPQTETGQVSLLGNPLNFSRTPVRYRKAPPRVGEDGDRLDEILQAHRARRKTL